MATNKTSDDQTLISYTSPYPIYAMSFSGHRTAADNHHLIAVGSFLEDFNNRVDIIRFNDETLTLIPHPHLSFPHPYPPTKLMFRPPSHDGGASSTPLLASSADFLRLFSVRDDVVEELTVLNNSKTSEFCAPLTSFDWNEHVPGRIGTCSVDTTCTVWDVERGVVETQLIAHDKEVYDIAWGEAGVFASVSADGSVRVFDLRDKEHSTIVYESPEPDTPLLRLAWNKRDLRYMATVLMDSNKVVVLDIRSPTMPVAELERHCGGGVNAVAWAPQSGAHLCSAGDDGQALIWEVPNVGGAGVGTGTGEGVGGSGVDPVLMYSAGSEINQLQWSSAQPDWIGVAFSNKLQLLRV
ncbi:hypothetical protein vseg_014796 [Gypsophila vaccaria]